MPALVSRSRRLVAIGAALALASAASITAAPVASAKAECYVALKAPARVAVDRSYRDVSVSLKDPCGVADYAAFYLYGPEGIDDIFLFEDGDTTDHLDVYDWRTLGTFTTREGGAWDADANELGFRATTIKIKLGTRAAVSAKRGSRNKVTVTASSTSYSPTKGTFTAWNAGSAVLQYKSGTTWQTLKSLKLKSGKASYSYTSKARRSYRLVTGETSTRFGATSGSATR
jgi:hypothetical protein